MVVSLHGDDSSSLPTNTMNTWRSAKQCGPNCLYALLRLNGRDVTLADVVSEAKPGWDGVSLKQLKEASSRFGLNTDVVEVKKLSALTGLRFPVIAHLSGAREGHFVLLLGVDRAGDAVLIADASKCEMEKQPIGQFSQAWSGYLLVPRSHWRQLWLSRVLSWISIAMVCCAIFETWRYLTRKKG